MKRLLKDLWKVFIITMLIILVDIIIPFVSCLLPAIGAAYVATFFTSNEIVIFVIGLCVYCLFATVLVLLIKRYENKRKKIAKRY